MSGLILRNYYVGTPASFGLLAMRIVVGLAFVMHGFMKMQHATSWMGPDSWAPPFLQAIAACAEFFGGLGLIAGLLTPIAALGIMVVMLTALFTVHIPHGDAFVAHGPGKSFELPLTYLASAFCVFMIGPGAFSLDAIISRNRVSKAAGPKEPATAWHH